MSMREIKGFKDDGEFIIFETYEDGVKEYNKMYDKYELIDTTRYFKIKKELLKDLIGLLGKQPM